MDSFFGIGIMELAFIAILALIVLGPERLPGAAREVAKVIAQIRAISSEFTSQFSEELQMLDEINPKKLADEIVKETMNPPKKPQTTSTAVSRSPAKPAPAAEEPAEQATTASSTSTGTEADEPVTDDPVTDAVENTILPPTGSDSTTAADRAANEPAVNGHHGAVAVDAEPASPASAGSSTASPNGAGATAGDSASNPAGHETGAESVADSAPDSASDSAEKEA